MESETAEGRLQDEKASQEKEGEKEEEEKEKERKEINETSAFFRLGHPKFSVDDLQASEINKLFEDSIEWNNSPNLRADDLEPRNTFYSVKKLSKNLKNRSRNFKTRSVSEDNKAKIKGIEWEQNEKLKETIKRRATKSKEHTTINPKVSTKTPKEKFANDWNKYNWDVEHTRLHNNNEDRKGIKFSKSTKILLQPINFAFYLIRSSIITNFVSILNQLNNDFYLLLEKLRSSLVTLDTISRKELKKFISFMIMILYEYYELNQINILI